MTWYTAAAEAGAWEGTVLRVAILLGLIGLVLWLMKRCARTGEQQRGEALQRKYAVLPPSAMATLSDEELVAAVIANSHAKLNPQRPDPYRTLPLYSHERAVAYAVWLVHQELREHGGAAWLRSPARQFGEFAVEGLTACEAVGCAEALRQAMESPSAGSDWEAAYGKAAEEEQPMARLATYIRDNAAQIGDEEEGA